MSESDQDNSGPIAPEKTTDDGQDPSAPSDDEARATELKALFDAWDSRKAPAQDAQAEIEPPTGGWTLDPIRLWGTATLFIACISLWGMSMLWTDVQYWTQRGAPPVELGSLNERYIGGERSLDVESNRYVSVTGLFSTFESEGEAVSAKAGEDKAILGRFFLCPLFNVVVRTQAPFAKKPLRQQWSLEVDSAFVPLMEQRRAFPSDLVYTTQAKGRLLKPSDVPYWHADPLLYYERITPLAASEMLLLVDDSKPEDMLPSVVFFGILVIAATLSFALYIRALMRRRRRRVAA